MAQRQPAVAGQFYPNDPVELQQTIESLLRTNVPPPLPSVKAVMSPHAGYIFSGAACAMALQCTPIPETVIILCPNHHGRGATLAFSQDDWILPTGTISCDLPFITTILDRIPLAQCDKRAHEHEHAIEVILPFLLALQPRVHIVPLCLGRIPLQDGLSLAKILALTIEEKKEDVLVIASSDMNHYESRTVCKKKDALAMHMIEKLSPEGLYSTVSEHHITMCGVLPMVIAMQTALNLGANRAQTLCSTDSGEYSGDTDHVVSYAATALYREP